MKNLFPILILTMTITQNCNSQSAEEKAVTSIVQSFATAAEEHNIITLKSILHDDYRVALNRLFGSTKVEFWDKNTYLNMIESKKIGGDHRKVEVDYIAITGNNAVVNTRFIGEKNTMTLYLLLARTTENNWQVLYDYPQISEN